MPDEPWLEDFEVTVVMSTRRHPRYTGRVERRITLVIPAVDESTARHGAAEISMAINGASGYRWSTTRIEVRPVLVAAPLAEEGNEPL
jgi:hypothetical protein